MTHIPGEKLLKLRDNRAGQAQWLVAILGMVCQEGHGLHLGALPLGEALRRQENEVWCMVGHGR
jgi:hypothetical protein